jgi:hypothetical protein
MPFAFSCECSLRETDQSTFQNRARFQEVQHSEMLCQQPRVGVLYERDAQ